MHWLPKREGCSWVVVLETFKSEIFYPSINDARNESMQKEDIQAEDIIPL